MKLAKAVIFDMDGVLVDNNPWHIEAWITFCRTHSLKKKADELISHLGNTNVDYLEFLFSRKLSLHEINSYSNEKEEIFREIYKNHMKPVNGLLDLLDLLKEEAYSLAVATSAPTKNVDYILDGIGIRDRFHVIVDASIIKKGKPDPEIYLLVSHKLGVPASKCIVFEDSIHGVQAAVSAGMHAIGVLTTQTKDKLDKAHYLIKDFTEISADLLNRILHY